jgi:hypothetical protein
LCIHLKMLSSDAIRKILYFDDAQTASTGPSSALTRDGSKTGLRYSTCYDGPILSSVGFETSSAIQPRSAYGYSAAILATTTLGCLTMRARNKEKWWVGLFGVNLVYFSALKAHKVENGLVGHQCGFFGDALLIIGVVARIMVRSGSMKHNASLLCASSAMLWYDLGRFHLWSDYVAQLRRDVTPERSFDLLAEFTPQDLAVEFLNFRRATVKENKNEHHTL